MDVLQEQMLRELKGLNSASQFEEAFAMGDRYVRMFQATEPISAHIWFQVALSANLTGRDPKHYQEQARKAPDYTATLEGDMLRDDALRFIRQHKFKQAEALLPKIAKLHEGDDNRLAVLDYTYGRLNLAKGRYDDADSRFEKAYKLWMNTADADPNWVTTLWFHWLRASIMLKSSNARVCFNNFIAEEPADTQRVKRATLMVRHGRLAAWLDIQLERFAS